MFGYHVRAPDEAMLISGGKATASDAPFAAEAHQASLRAQAEYAHQTEGG
jgi:hypothetical protein